MTFEFDAFINKELPKKPEPPPQTNKPKLQTKPVAGIPTVLISVIING